MELLSIVLSEGRISKYVFILSLAFILLACGTVENSSTATVNSPNLSASQTTIDVAVVYEQQIAYYYAYESIVQQVWSAVDEANHTFARSGSSVRLRLVAVRPVNYTSNGNYIMDLNFVEASSEIAVMRDTVGADLVSMFVFANSSVAKGMAYLNKFPSIVHWGSSAGNYTFVHELSHNLGAGHEHGQTNSLGRTIMSSNGFYRRVGYFTGYSGEFYGEPFSIPMQSSLSIIERNAPIAAAYKEARPAAEAEIQNTVSGQTITCRVNVLSSQKIVRVHFVRNNAIVGNSDGPDFTMDFQNCQPGEHTVQVILETDQGAMYELREEVIVVENVESDPIWSVRNLGTTIDAEFSVVFDEYGEESIELYGTASQLSDSRDHGAFLYTSVQGDCEFIVRLENIIGEAGIMLRANLSSDSAYEGIYTFASISAIRKGRYSKAHLPSDFTLMSTLENTFCRIRRIGKEIEVSLSVDGVNWSETHQIIANLPNQAYIGIFTSGASPGFPLCICDVTLISANKVISTSLNN